MLFEENIELTFEENGKMWRSNCRLRKIVFTQSHDSVVGSDFPLTAIVLERRIDVRGKSLVLPKINNLQTKSTPPVKKLIETLLN